MVLVQAPSEFGPLLARAGGAYDKGCRGWWVERRRIGPLIRSLKKRTDPLFRKAGMELVDRPEDA